MGELKTAVTELTQTSLGFCCGATTLTAVEVERRNGSILVQRVNRLRHEADPKAAFSRILSEMDLSRFKKIAVTGRQFRHSLYLSTISEPQAVETALRYTQNDGGKYDAVVSAGGESFVVYGLDREGKIASVHTGNKCASGTGEFFLQQIRRLNVNLDQAMSYAVSEEPYFVSGRCSVFCKSDCTHASNKGIPKGQVIAGLCNMMAGKVLDLLNVVTGGRILMIGGTAQNHVLTDFLERELRELKIPQEATYFEALGAACWALENETQILSSPKNVFKTPKSRFEFLEPLANFNEQVVFNRTDLGRIAAGDHCIVGVDVGSTTTKAVLLRRGDCKVLASEYLRTNGDPIAAARACYASLSDQVDGVLFRIDGLGVTGSGRQIVGLHAQTDGIINEIIAHATASVFYDPEVDTIFEIGGQDAKYTYITNGVASDYAMNEACSAGTGSFLEESAKETLGIDMAEIAVHAMRGSKPPNFNDQCAAFISSDIKNAFHEGISRDDIAAGLVYSVCMNYVNRVKGARPVGGTVFMQGGVCYNEAVPLAMAALTGKKIVVPPDPGLAGAFGVALEVVSRIEGGVMPPGEFDLDSLAGRKIQYGSPFVCRGGKEKCDLGCRINRIEIEGRSFPFGGSCNRYYNMRKHIEVDAGAHDLVALRQKLVFETFASSGAGLPRDAPTVGLNRSFLMHTYYPFFSTFFTELGYRPVLPSTMREEGKKKRTAPFCHPCELAHGFFLDLVESAPDVLFLPHIRGTAVDNSKQEVSNLCPLVQGEAYYLRGAFEDILPQRTKILSPVLDFSMGEKYVDEMLAKTGRALGASRAEVARAVEAAKTAQSALERRMKELGAAALEQLGKDPSNIAVVLFGRPYNAFTPEAHKGVPHKFASRGITAIPIDFLDLGEYPDIDHMYWSMGQVNLKGAMAVRDHNQLFGAYITNFSCGPDSFIIGYFRDMMGNQPSLTLELDDHTADAGLETRIEAFLDIVARYRQLLTPEELAKPSDGGESQFQPAVEREIEGSHYIETSSGELVSIRDRRLKLILPSMGRFGAPSLAAACRCYGINAEALDAMDEVDISIGKANTLCKECLPLQLTTGSLLKYLHKGRPADEVTVFFMPTAKGPCRFGQYQIFIRNLIRKKRIPNIALMSLSAEDNYGGLGAGFIILGWYATLVADCFQDIRHSIIVNALEPEKALETLDSEYKRVLAGLERGKKHLLSALRETARVLRRIPARRSIHELPRILLAGEIYVRQEDIARQWIPEYLADHGIVTHVAPLHEWVYYTNWLRSNAKLKIPLTPKQRINNTVVRWIMSGTARHVKSILAGSGWYIPVHLDMNRMIALAENLISKELYGEAILTVAGPLAGLGTEFCGAIAVGPFGCMPNRLSESLLSGKLNREHLLKIRSNRDLKRVFDSVEELPFLSIEVDGSSLPQIITARLETFVMQSLRLHQAMRRK